MVTRINELLQDAMNLSSDAERRQAAIALMRLVWQHAVISLAEWAIETGPASKRKAVGLNGLSLEQLRAPSDGTLVAALSELLVFAENNGWDGVSRMYWRVVPHTRPARRLSKHANPNLDALFNAFVSLRNDGVEGHGLPGAYDSEAELDLVGLALVALAPVLPIIDVQTGELRVVTGAGQSYTLQLLREFGRDLVCYRKIEKSADGKCKVRAQQQQSLFSRSDVSFEAKDILAGVDVGGYPSYNITKSSDTSWSPFTLLPARLTSEFVGRENELRELQEWADDSDSRACILYGDGGIGKTTLAVEFVHRH